jgi:uncharacterized protein (DUF433 family)
MKRNIARILSGSNPLKIIRRINIESGDTTETFPSDFPTVERKQVMEVLELAGRILTTDEPVAGEYCSMIV